MLTVRIFKNHPLGHPARLAFSFKTLRGPRTVRLAWLGPIIVLVRFGR